MTARRPLVLVDGQTAQLPPGDTVVGASGLPLPTQVGQTLLAVDESAFVAALPLTSPDAGWLMNGQGFLLVVG